MKFFASLFFLLTSLSVFAQMYSTLSGEVDFVSDAPLEVIKASTKELQGILDLDKKRFAFKLYIRSFEGFNNPLQQVHFYENYMEADDYPIATFKGKILEKIVNGAEDYRAKGILEIHGQVIERVINVQLDINEETVSYKADFIVPLADHDIKLPRIVYQKIAEEINVSIRGTMKRK